MVGRIHGLKSPRHRADPEDFVSPTESGLIEDTIDTLYESVQLIPRFN
jgi:hypothetical protein